MFRVLEPGSPQILGNTHTCAHTHTCWSIKSWEREGAGSQPGPRVPQSALFHPHPHLPHSAASCPYWPDPLGAISLAAGLGRAGQFSLPLRRPAVMGPGTALSADTESICHRAHRWPRPAARARGALARSVRTVSLAAVSTAGGSICFSSVSGKAAGHRAPPHAGPSLHRGGGLRVSPSWGPRFGIRGCMFLRKSPSYLQRARVRALCCQLSCSLLLSVGKRQ